jgi:hypothetical protein
MKLEEGVKQQGCKLPFLSSINASIHTYRVVILSHPFGCNRTACLRNQATADRFSVNLYANAPHLRM